MNSKIINKLNFFLSFQFKNNSHLKKLPKIQKERVKPWFAVDGDNTLRLNYDLNEDSVVFDLGGYKGEWSSAIHKKYNSHLYIFEPSKMFYEELIQRFQGNNKINVFNFGLSSKDHEISLFQDDNSSSTFEKKCANDNLPTELIKLKNFWTFVEKLNIQKIDLIKINIEGGEYELLEYMTTKTELMRRISNIQVQFHDFERNSKQRMNKIQSALSKTHYLTYQFEFVWENWKLKKV